MNNYILKIDCSDAKGLIYKISDVIYKSDLNIVKNDEYVDKENGKFFFRAIINGDIENGNLVSKLTEVMPENANIYLTKKVKKKIIIMATKESHCLGDLLLKYYSGELNAEIVAVVSNYDYLQDLVEKFDIPYHHVCHEGLNRLEHEAKVLDVLKNYECDFIVLAKYMRILSSDFVGHYNEKMINIHHSFLPAFIGANPYKQAFIRGVKTIGATAHFVNNNLDEGPIIAQDVINVDHEFSWRDMQKAGRNVEKVVLSNALELVLDERVFVHANKTIIF
ncbi:formyltetrahydrofolate deformylase [Sulfurospirillum arcachonense]|uniref:formyltetrahydrofolate deformylase n=1 Tax=Sulfurospirillum arcachonense TaxID=57666 RepID=UPI0004691F0A|nr:formyltetrahydrofolate deformylase [Sulfurospirillum arcachonense]